MNNLGLLLWVSHSLASASHYPYPPLGIAMSAYKANKSVRISFQYLTSQDH